MSRSKKNKKTNKKKNFVSEFYDLRKDLNITIKTSNCLNVSPKHNKRIDASLRVKKFKRVVKEHKPLTSNLLRISASSLIYTAINFFIEKIAKYFSSG